MKILEEHEIQISEIFRPINIEKKESKKPKDLLLHAISMLIYAMIFFLLLTNL